jgi:hypothetical protein
VTFSDLTANVALGYNVDYWRRYKGFSEIYMHVSDARSRYQALQVALERRRGAFTFGTSYTWSLARDNATVASEPTDAGVSTLDDEWGPASHDRRHIIVSRWNWRLPSSRGHGWKARILGDWHVAGVARFQSGIPFTVTGHTSIGSRRADYLGGNPYRFGVNATTGAVTWLDPAQFAVAPETRRGTSRRNQFVGPPYRTWDVSISKAIALRGRVSARIQADIFNAFNRVNWNNPASSLTGGTPFGTITSAGPPRQMQIGFRLTF